ncbi:hypothetical protein VFPPC_16633 [Pochonia chlamydosporia 170]|uniref:Uncharacterized protein n=1 Tax=Pochonia chlamydosporia 170 TaxID=1380566 RepID=A0A179FAZ0_METCM|nr:hypothetical protein VFPPC_16633 [Pochonia chlamydosporia 170]OAQ62269.1 hypothetical protein VFPPC_16633 [Pochonia chlamydosporia 170]
MLDMSWVPLLSNGTISSKIVTHNSAQIAPWKASMMPITEKKGDRDRHSYWTPHSDWTRALKIDWDVSRPILPYGDEKQRRLWEQDFSPHDWYALC